ncbi:MAG: hypothetical protein JWL61_1090 [Gemmatimonadetes bacterium]|nr:hypothetical protein [Gemmatimonadota bacterium]
MHPGYQDALLTAAETRLRELTVADRLEPYEIQRAQSVFFVPFRTKSPADRYLARIDAERFPVDPYEVGFINPETPLAERMNVSSKDPRYWPWSPMPGIHGSFNTTFNRAIRVFWCRECTASYFYYHGGEADRSWHPARWPLERVVTELIDAASKAEHPRIWRANQRVNLLLMAQQSRIELPPGAGIDDD